MKKVLFNLVLICICIAGFGVILTMQRSNQIIENTEEHIENNLFIGQLPSIQDVKEVQIIDFQNCNTDSTDTIQTQLNKELTEIECIDK